MIPAIDLKSLWPELNSWFPGAQPADFSVLGEGLDHAVLAYRDLVVRIPKTTEYIERAKTEYAVLLSVSRTEELAPKPVKFDALSGWLALERKEGVSLNLAIETDAGWDRLAVPRQLGEFLTRLHGRAEAVPGIPEERPDWKEYREQALDDLTVLRPRLAGTAVPRLEDRLDREPPEAGCPSCLLHGDLGAEHVLVDAPSTRITGVIDWSDTCFGDPAVDLARLLRDLGPEPFGALLASYGGPAAGQKGFRDRIRYFAACFALEDARYGVEEDKPGYLRRGLAALERLS